MRAISLLVVHCSATRAASDIGAAEIDKWHRSRGWRKIGYHYVIRRDGTCERGRAEAEIGAHTQGHNSTSIGICMVGGLGVDGGAEANFTAPQYQALEGLLGDLLQRYPESEVLGHRDLSPDIDGDGIIEKHEWVKMCPSFDVRDWMKSRGMLPP